MTTQTLTLSLDNSKEDAIAQINFHKQMLIGFRHTTGFPDELEWEIRVYDYMLEDPINRLNQYMAVRFDSAGLPREKRKVVELLGWEIP